MYGGKSAAPVLAFTGVGMQVGWGVATAAACIGVGVALVAMFRRQKVKP